MGKIKPAKCHAGPFWIEKIQRCQVVHDCFIIEKTVAQPVVERKIPVWLCDLGQIQPLSHSAMHATMVY